MTNHKDLSYLNMAYALAVKGRGRVSPNPQVGAVVAKNDVILGYGYHESLGKPHAEIIALNRAGSCAKNSVLYVTLEPCVHWGRTSPCVDRVIGAGLKRVVVSSYDPNPLVYRKGIRRIRGAGIEVSVGLLEERDEKLNECYRKYITQRIPFVTVKAAVSLDGKIATKTGSSRWISSPQTREYIHLLRGEYDAIMVGINTVIRDNPRLTVRHGNWKGKKTARVILDSSLRLPLSARILSTSGKGKILVFTSEKASKRKADALRERGVGVIPVSTSKTGLDLKQVLTFLGKQEVASILVEGGGSLFTSLVSEKLADKIFLSISPRLIGGKRAPSLYEGEGAELIKDALRLKKTTFSQIEEDIIVEGYF